MGEQHRMLKSRFMLLAVSLLLSGCGEWVQESSVSAPDDRLVALVEYKGSAACCSDHSRVWLENGEGGTLTERVLIAEVTRARARARWVNPDKLVIEACSASEVDARTRVLREPIVLQDGSINAVHVDVVTAPETMHDGVEFCGLNAHAE